MTTPYGGRWFEEYCYCRLKREFKLTDDAIGKSAAIYREGSQSNDNEIDVLFVKDNMLYIFECKVGMIGNNSPKETIEQYQYKLAAIAKDFGLKVEAYILTLHKIFNNKTFSDSTIANIRKRQSILGLRGIIDSSAFAQTTPLIENYARQTTRQDTKTTPIKEVGKVATGEPIKEKPAERQDFIETVIPSISLKIIGKIEL